MKRPYQRPILIPHGTLVQLTALAGTQVNDAFNGSSAYDPDAGACSHQILTASGPVRIGCVT